MDYKLVTLVLLFYFIRPQDWLVGMTGLNIMKPLMGLTLIAMFVRRRGFTPKSLVKTPIDWAMIAYGLFIVLASPEGTAEYSQGSQAPFTAVAALLAYYFVTSQALSTPRRLTIFLRCWFIAIIVVATLAILSEFGFDPTGAHDITHKIPDKPRLVLNTYLFDNPNSLGHSVILAIPLAYFVLFWRAPKFSRLFGIGFALVAAYCAYLTQSKGAYIIGLCVLGASQIIGRRRIVQLIAIFLGVTLGWGAISQLPRMTDLAGARKDEAIMGRLLAWEQSRVASKLSNNGQGWKSFRPMIEFEGKELFKATHSSYVLVGAELGRNGMFFYVGVLYACLRALLSARCHREDEERSRRALFVLILGYMLSGWLIDRSYHLEYFLMAGAVAAFHRRQGVNAGVVSAEGEITEDEYEEEENLEVYENPDVLHKLTKQLEEAEHPQDPFGGPRLAYAIGVSTATQVQELPSLELLPPEPSDDTIGTVEEVDTSRVAEEAIEEELTRRRYWHKISIIDILMVILLTKGVFELWDYLLESYFYQ